MVYFSCIFIFRINFVHFFLPLPGYLHEDLTFLPSRASNRQIHSEYFFFTFIRKVTWLIKFETRKCSEVKDLTFFPSAVVFAKTYFTFLPSRAANRPNSFGILQPLSNKTNRNTTTVPAEGNSSKRPIVFNNCHVTNNKKRIFLKTTNKRYYSFSQCSK
jgi:hypothetical protein